MVKLLLPICREMVSAEHVCLLEIRFHSFFNSFFLFSFFNLETKIQLLQILTLGYSGEEEERKLKNVSFL